MTILIIAGVVGFVMAAAIGANDVANSMATAVGAKAITIKQAVVIAAILEFTGAVFFGKNVTSTIKAGIVNAGVLNNPHLFMYGAFAALIGASIWTFIATHYSLPVSTTHSIVGGMVGFGIAAAGVKAIYWVKIGFITLTWVLSPIAGLILAFIIYKFISISILHRKRPLKAAKIVAPFIIGMVGIVVFLSFMMKVLHTKDASMYWYSILVALVVYIVFFIILKFVKGKKEDEIDNVEGIFRYLQVITSSYVSLAHGSNDVANAIGPLAAIYAVVATGVVGSNVSVPKILLIIGGGGISVGVALWGSKVMKTVGKDITHLNNTRGLSVDFATATTVLVSSMMGMPVSTTHTVVGSVIGVGLARGFESVNFKVLKNIVYSWILTIPIAAIISAGIYRLILLFFH